MSVGEGTGGVCVHFPFICSVSHEIPNDAAAMRHSLADFTSFSSAQLAASTYEYRPERSNLLGIFSWVPKSTALWEAHLAHLFNIFRGRRKYCALGGLSENVSVSKLIRPGPRPRPPPPRERESSARPGGSAGVQPGCSRGSYGCQPGSTGPTVDHQNMNKYGKD